MASEDAHVMFQLLQDFEKEHDWVLREIVHRRLENDGWGEVRVEDTEDELFLNDAIMEDIPGNRLTTTRKTL